MKRKNPLPRDLKTIVREYAREFQGRVRCTERLPKLEPNAEEAYVTGLFNGWEDSRQRLLDLINSGNRIVWHTYVVQEEDARGLTLMHPTGPAQHWKARYLDHCEDGLFIFERESGEHYLLLAHEAIGKLIRIAVSSSQCPKVYRCTLGRAVWVLCHVWRTELVTWDSDSGVVIHSLPVVHRDKKRGLLRGDEFFYQDADTWFVFNLETRERQALECADGTDVLAGVTDDLLVLHCGAFLRILDRYTGHFQNAPWDACGAPHCFRTLLDGTLLAFGPGSTVSRFQAQTMRFKQVWGQENAEAPNCIIALPKTIGCAFVCGNQLLVLE